MEINNVINTLSVVLSNNDKRSELVNNFHLYTKNKNLYFRKYFQRYFFDIFISSIYIVLLINKEFFNIFDVDKNLAIIIRIIINIISIYPITSIIFRLLNFKIFVLPSMNEIKVYIKKFNNFIESKRSYKEFKKYRLRCYTIQSIIPLLTIILYVLLLTYDPKIENFFIYIIGILSVSYFISDFINENYTAKFIVEKVYDEIPKEEIIERELINIDDHTIYISEKENSIILYDNIYIKIKQNSSKFMKSEYNLLITFLKEIKNFLQKESKKIKKKLMICRK